MALAQPQVLGDLPHRDVLVPVVLADVIHRLEDILALVPLLPLRQGGGGPAPFRLHTAAQLITAASSSPRRGRASAGSPPLPGAGRSGHR